jgi:hypothetical protein
MFDNNLPAVLSMIGTKLAHFEITSHLGTGGMEEVYQATDAKLGRSDSRKGKSISPHQFSAATCAA